MKMKRKKTKIPRTIPPVGTVLIGKFFGKQYIAKIVEDKKMPAGRGIKYNGNVYPSFTSAAQAITKQPTNGWRFWRIK
jgi:hypothetical protein